MKEKKTHSDIYKGKSMQLIVINMLTLCVWD